MMSPSFCFERQKSGMGCRRATPAMYYAFPRCGYMDNVATCWSRSVVGLPWHERMYAMLFAMQSQILYWQKLQPNNGRRAVHCAEAA